MKDSSYPGLSYFNEYNNIVRIFFSALDIFWERIFKVWLYPSFIFHLTKIGKRWIDSLEEGRKFTNEVVIIKILFKFNATDLLVSSVAKCL